MRPAKECLVPVELSDISDEDFIFFSELIFKISGITLSLNKKDLVKSRLRSHIQSKGLSSYFAYRSHLTKLTSEDPEWQKFINLLTTNKTDFFRETQHFDYLRDAVLNKWPSNEDQTLKVWCCASSSGEEPYTLGMVFEKYLIGATYKILATDIDTDVLAKAKNGVYPVKKLSEIPEEFRQGSLCVGTGDVERWFKIKDQICNKISFKQHNLVENSYPGEEVFDLIFCRNVLIYFSATTIKTLMYKLHRSLKKDGLLFIGHSESISGSSEIFKMVKPAIYRKA